jgi:hypothetical protein
MVDPNTPTATGHDNIARLARDSPRCRDKPATPVNTSDASSKFSSYSTLSVLTRHTPIAFFSPYVNNNLICSPHVLTDDHILTNFYTPSHIKTDNLKPYPNQSIIKERTLLIGAERHELINVVNNVHHHIMTKDRLNNELCGEVVFLKLLPRTKNDELKKIKTLTSHNAVGNRLKILTAKQTEGT